MIDVIIWTTVICSLYVFMYVWYSIMTDKIVAEE